MGSSMANQEFTRQQAISFAAMLVALVSISLGFYIFQSIGFLSYAHRMAPLDLDMLRDHYYQNEPLLFSFKYFIYPSMLFLMSVVFVFRLKLWILGGVTCVYAIWLAMATAQQYYGLLNFYLVVGTGCAIELIAIAVLVVLLVRQTE